MICGQLSGAGIIQTLFDMDLTTKSFADGCLKNARQQLGHVSYWLFDRPIGSSLEGDPEYYTDDFDKAVEEFRKYSQGWFQILIRSFSGGQVNFIWKKTWHRDAFPKEPEVARDQAIDMAVQVYANQLFQEKQNESYES